MYSPPTGGPVVASKDYEGLTLRDYFAAMAMQGMLAREYVRPLRIEDLYACDAYIMADAMLKTRELFMLKAGVQK
jgi:hypothetical protein